MADQFEGMFGTRTRHPFDGDRYVVAGHYHDGSGRSETIYGPYDQARATAIAQELARGDWLSMTWQAYPLTLTPWESVGPTTRAATSS